MTQRQKDRMTDRQNKKKQESERLSNKETKAEIEEDKNEK